MKYLWWLVALQATLLHGLPVCGKPEQTAQLLWNTKKTFFMCRLHAQHNRCLSGLYYENATHQLRNVIRTQKYTLRKRKKKNTETHGITARKRIIPASMCSLLTSYQRLTLLWSLQTTFLKTTLMWILNWRNFRTGCGLNRRMCLEQYFIPTIASSERWILCETSQHTRLSMYWRRFRKQCNSVSMNSLSQPTRRPIISSVNKRQFAVAA